MNIKGQYKLQVIRGGKTIHEESGHNMIVDEGKNAILDIMFYSTAKKSWFVGLINNSPAPDILAADTGASHAGWVETTAYTPAGDRQALTVGAASSNSITTSAQAEFTLTGNVNLYGFFICDEEDNTVTPGTLWCTAMFDSVITGITGDVIKVDYSVLIQ